MRQFVLSIALLIGGTAGIYSQARGGGDIQFDAASIKENTTGGADGSEGEEPGGYTARNLSVRSLILRAYGLPAFRISGGPSWINSARFDIVARSRNTSTDEGIFAMLRTLLADRFKLRTHTETREQPIYALVLARGDGRLGSALKPSIAACVDARDNPCRMSGSFSPNGGRLSGVGQPLTTLAAQLAKTVNRVVLDRTGLIDRFDFDLTWGPTLAAAAAPAAPDEPPPVFTAIQEQLGLRLEPARGPVEMLVIDSAERPAAD
jgi:uncharacterized protein (TIGR03435 family)